MRWQLKAANTDCIASLQTALSECLSPRPAQPYANALATLLATRGITDAQSARRFLDPSLSHLHSPYLMTGMKAAVDRLDAAIESKEPLLIYGDYDVDGTTAIVILKTAIELCGGEADFHVPHRVRDGYDMRDDVIERAAAAGIRLIISVDMGIRAFAPAQTAQRLGVDLIVTDHHLPGPDGVPHALAVVNPNQAGCDYPCKALCGAGVAFKLAQALLEKRRPGSDLSRLLTSFLKIVAIATVADAVPLADENRVFAKLGLEGLRTAVNPGLKALLEIAQLSGRPLTSGEVAFRIAPRINAAGRMDVARDVIELFSVKDPGRARDLASRLDKLNSERQEEERRILDAIHARIAEDAGLRDAYCMVIDGDGWHRGVIGITATRVVERYGRPALVVSRDGDEAHGSGRSIPAFHLLNALESCSGLFSRFGGHAHAAGFSLPATRVAELRSHLEGYARERLSLADFEPMLKLDAELPLQQVTPELFQLLEKLEPFGVGNPQPVFAARGLPLTAPPQIIKDKHVKLRLKAAVEEAAAAAFVPRCHPDSAALKRSAAASAFDGSASLSPETMKTSSSPEIAPPSNGWRNSIAHTALGWRMAERIQQEQLLPGDTLDIAFTLDHNDHPDFGGLELTLRDFQVRSKSRTATEGVASQTRLVET